MKTIFIVGFLFCITLAFSQEQLDTVKNTGEAFIEIATDSTLISPKDSTQVSEKDRFIKDYTNRFNVKFEVSNSLPIYEIPYPGGNKYVQIEPNLGTKYAFVLSYKFLSVRLGIRAKGSDESIEDKGEPKSFRLHFKLLFNRWLHNFEYNQIKGYYISESVEPIEQFTDGNYVQFPDLQTITISGITSYKINDNYSVRATKSQTEKQIKSAGSLIPSLHYAFYDISGADNYMAPDGTPHTRDEYAATKGFTTTFNLGYYYTFVYRNWFINAFVISGIGADFNKITTYSTEVTNSNYTDFILSLKGGAGFGYTNQRFFLGGGISKTGKKQKNNANKTQFTTLQDAFSVYVGYRFKAPKKIAKPIDNFEEKFPFHDKKNKQN